MTEAIDALDGHRRDIEYDIPFARIAFGRGVAIGAVSRRLFAVTALGARGWRNHGGCASGCGRGWICERCSPCRGRDISP